MMTLDIFYKSYNLIPELVKIDVEGSEIDIFYDGEFNVQNEINSKEYMILNKKIYNIMLDINAKN